MDKLSRPNQYKLYIFDFDYTLFDTSRGVVDCMKAAFAAAGIHDVSEEEIKKGIGLSFGEFFGRYTSDQKTIESMEQAFLRRSAETMIELTKPFDGTISVINELHARGSKLAICTGKYRDRVCQTLAKYSIEEQFDFVVCGDEITKQKPDPEGITKCLVHFEDIGKNQTIYVGDHYYDVLAAHNCGIDSVAVTSGSTSQLELLKYKPTFLINDLLEILG